MAITWVTKITNIRLDTKRADVSTARTDGLDIFTQSYQNTPIAGSTPAETTAARVLLMDTFWDAWQQELTKRSRILTIVSNLEELANNNLMNREP